MAITYTVGGMIVFPGDRVDRRPTINGARGMHPRIRDRMDRTLECIRRYYAGEASPLEEVLDRYADFFRLFENFAGYVSFFLLDYMVTIDYSAVRFNHAVRGIRHTICSVRLTTRPPCNRTP